MSKSLLWVDFRRSSIFILGSQSLKADKGSNSLKKKTNKQNTSAITGELQCKKRRKLCLTPAEKRF
jgi:hypothetical protein